MAVAAARSAAGSQHRLPDVIERYIGVGVVAVVTGGQLGATVAIGNGD